jgi:hypothetical protein
MVVYFATLDSGGAHSAFRVMITFAARRHEFLLRTLLLDIYRTYFAIAHMAVRIAVFLISGVSMTFKRSIN